MDTNLAVSNNSKEGAVDYTERRCEERFKAAQSAIVTTLNGTASTLTGSILDVSKRGLKLGLERPLAAGTPVRIDVEADMILGEIRYCTQQAGLSSYELGIEMDQILRNAKQVGAGWVQRSWPTAA